MEKSTPVRKPSTNTMDLLTWSETPPPPSADSFLRRPHKPSNISPALFGGQMTEEEVESVNKRKTCSGSKLREITGSGIFAADNENGASEFSSSVINSNTRTSVRICQQAVSSISQISFSAEECVSPKKPTSLPEVAKQRELSGTLVSESETKVKQISDAKCKELLGHDIFGPPPEILPRPLAPRNLELQGQLYFGEPVPCTMHSSGNVSNAPGGGHSNNAITDQSVIKTAKKINNQKFQDLTGNGIFKGDASPASTDKMPSSAKLREMTGSDIFKGDASPASTDKMPSSAKLREMTGSDIFADGKAAARDYFGGVRKPPGGGSSIALV